MKKIDKYKFRYDERILIDILTICANEFRYQTSIKYEKYGCDKNPERQKELNRNAEKLNRIYHLDFAEDLGLMKLINLDKNTKMALYRMTYRGIRYLGYCKFMRCIIRNYYGNGPLFATIGIVIAWLTLIIALLSQL